MACLSRNQRLSGAHDRLVIPGWGSNPPLANAEDVPTGFRNPADEAKSRPGDIAVVVGLIPTVGMGLGGSGYRPGPLVCAEEACMDWEETKKQVARNRAPLRDVCDECGGKREFVRQLLCSAIDPPHEMFDMISWKCEDCGVERAYRAECPHLNKAEEGRNETKEKK